MAIPTGPEILALLSRLDTNTAEDIESQWLEFKPWLGPKDSRKISAEYAVCFANAEGGVIVFGVLDNTRGRSAAIQGAQGYNLDAWRRDIFASLNPNLDVQVEELAVPEGTGRLLVVRVPPGAAPLYGTTQGLFKRRVGKHCMPVDPQSFLRGQVSMGSVDWSGQQAEGMGPDALDPVEIARARAILRSKHPESGLLKLGDPQFLEGLEAVRGGKVTNTGVLLFGRAEVLEKACPQNQLHYVHQPSPTKVSRNDVVRTGLLNFVDRIEQVFSGPTNPEEELSLGLFKLRIPAFPPDAVREAVLNAITHRDYSDPGEVLVRHTPHELAITSPGGFVGGITLQNILRHEPVARNRTLANAFVKLRLVESAGTGRNKIFIPLLSYGKRMPAYESDGSQVTLRLFDGSYDDRMATLVAKWQQDGRHIELDSLMVLAYLKKNAFIDAAGASDLLQLTREGARRVLDQLALPSTGILERRGRTAATFHLAKGVAKDLLGKAAYTRTRGLDPLRYSEMVRQFVTQHGSITPRECRELLGLGNSPSASVEVSRYLKHWSAEGGFLRREGMPPRTKYVLLAPS